MTLNVVDIPTNVVRNLDIYREDWNTLVAAHGSNGVATNPVNELRNAGWREFERIGFPIHRRGNELWKYTDLRAVDRTEFRFGAPSANLARNELAAKIPLPSEWHNLVFVDGNLNRSLSDSEGLQTEVRFDSVPSFAELGKLATCADNAFVSLNSAFLDEGIFVDVDAAATVNKPIHLVFVTTGLDDGQ